MNLEWFSALKTNKMPRNMKCLQRRPEGPGAFCSASSQCSRQLAGLTASAYLFRGRSIACDLLSIHCWDVSKLEVSVLYLSRFLDLEKESASHPPLSVRWWTESASSEFSGLLLQQIALKNGAKHSPSSVLEAGPSGDFDVIASESKLVFQILEQCSIREAFLEFHCPESSGLSIFDYLFVLNFSGMSLILGAWWRLVMMRVTILVHVTWNQ